MTSSTVVNSCRLLWLSSFVLWLFPWTKSRWIRWRWSYPSCCSHSPEIGRVEIEKSNWQVLKWSVCISQWHSAPLKSSPVLLHLQGAYSVSSVCPQLSNFSAVEASRHAPCTFSTRTQKRSMVFKKKFHFGVTMKLKYTSLWSIEHVNIQCL